MHFSVHIYTYTAFEATLHTPDMFAYSHILLREMLREMLHEMLN